MYKMHQNHFLLGDRMKMKLPLPRQNDQMKVRFVSWWNIARPQEMKLLLPPQNDQMKVRFASWWNIVRPQERKLPFPVEMRSTSLTSDPSCAASLHVHEKAPSCRCNR